MGIQSILKTWEATQSNLKVKRWELLSRVQFFATPRTVVPQIPLFMGFSKQEYWSRDPFASPGDVTIPGIERESPAL